MTETEGTADPAVEAPETDTSDAAAADATTQPAVTLTAPTHVFVGGYTAEMGGGSAGLQAYAPGTESADADRSSEPTQAEPVDQSPEDAEDAADESGAAAPITLAEIAELELASPSYVIKHPTKPWLYAVSESSPGKVSAVQYDDTGLHLINSQDSGGDGGCHLCFDHSGDFVIVAHYTSGSIASFRIDENGALSERISLLEFSGSGPDPERQDGSHAHQVVSVGSSILVPDLGTDSVHIVHIDDEGNLTPATDSISLPPGSGPRHLVLAGRHLVVACELTATLWVSALDAEVGAEGVSVPTSTRETEQRIYPSAIAQFGDQIVVANRGADTLSVFTLDAYGTPHPLVEIDCGGNWPRDLTVDDDQLWVANQASDTVTVIKPSSVSNKPEDWQQVLQLPSPSPACVIPTR